jgi:uncharacterized membrane protein HdeD (DUF308 family)
MATHPLPDPAQVLFKAATRFSWLALLMGALALVAGVVVLVYPNRSLTVVTIAFGVYLVLLSPLRLALALAVPGLPATQRGLEVVISVFALIAGIVVIANPGTGLLAIALAFGVYLLAAGTIHLYLGVTIPLRRAWNVAAGIVDLASGAIVIAYPHIGLTALAIILSVYLLVRAAFDLWLGWTLMRLRRAVG